VPGKVREVMSRFFLSPTQTGSNLKFRFDVSE
jgi:hypothetical protein